MYELPSRAWAPLARLERYLAAAVRAGAFPGAAVAFGRRGEPPTISCHGTLEPGGRKPVTRSTRYDLLCLTKPLGVGALLARAVAEEGLDLDAPVAETLPAFAAAGKEGITWTHLLAHGGGLLPSRSYARLDGAPRARILADLVAQAPRFAPGTRMEYSCDGFVVLGLALERRYGRPLDALVRERVHAPLGMDGARWYRDGDPVDANVAPAAHPTVDGGRVRRGRVCEALADALGGVAGNAGLFATIEDVARFAQAWIGDDAAGVPALFDPGVVARFSRPVDPARLDTRALAWDTRSAEGYTVGGRAFGPRSFGHTGASGCSLWIDPDAGAWVALLSNAVLVDARRRRYVGIRVRVSELVARIPRIRSQAPVHRLAFRCGA